ncbi:hypothetical protein AB0D08_33030 [Kitasatospora sp. NPDC048540]|nr:hypothetical protein [Kitasatospora sp. MBT63]
MIPIGQLRFNEDYDPYLLIVKDGTVAKLFTWSAGSDDAEPFLQGL